MKQIARLKFYMNSFLQEVKWKFWTNKQLEWFEQADDLDDLKEERAALRRFVSDMKQAETERRARRPELKPGRTMLFTSDGRRCNFLTAWWYRRQILRNYVWGKQCGFTNYVVDPYTPFGLLALETLGRFKRAGEELILYSVHGSHAGWRHSYRLIPETPLELLFLEHKACDYIYSQFRSEET